jgi:hypothetical protein
VPGPDFLTPSTSELVVGFPPIPHTAVPRAMTPWVQHIPMFNQKKKKSKTNQTPQKKTPVK